MMEGAPVARLRRVVRVALATLATLFGIFGSPATAQQPQRIIAVGDLHGDFQAWTAIAQAAGLTDTRGHWMGGKTTLVQLGDVTDRGPESLKIIRNLQQLQNEAPKKGGRVVVVLGNHEAMNLLGDNRYTSAGEYAAFVDGQSVSRRDRVFELNKATIEAEYRAKDPKIPVDAIRQQWIAATPLGWVEHKLAWQQTGELGKWATHNPAVVKIEGTIFVHGGLSAEYAALGIDEINRRVAAAMAAADDSPTSILSAPLGPLWYRGLAGPDPDAEADRPPVTNVAPRPTIDQELTTVLAATGAKRIVIGHTPILTGIAVTNGGRLARTDTGISRYYGGPLTWLEIVGDQLIPHSVGRPAP